MPTAQLIKLLNLALGPLFWVPIASRFGRRPVWIISVLGAMFFNIGCALSQTYAQHMVFRIFSAFFISPGLAMGNAVVTETFFAKDRARKMGTWTVMITLGTPTGPFIMGFVAQHLGWRWIYWLLSIVSRLCIFR